MHSQCCGERVHSASVVLHKAVSLLLDAQVYPALGAPHHALLAAARQLAAALNGGHIVRPVVVAIQANSINRVPIANRVSILSFGLALLQEQYSSSTQGAAKILAKHQGKGHVQLEPVQRQLGVPSLDLEQDVGVDNAQVNKVVQNAFVPLHRLGVNPVEGELLVTGINTSHANVVCPNQGRAGDDDVLLGCLVPPANLEEGLHAVGVGGNSHLLIVVPLDNKDPRVRQLVVNCPPALFAQLLLSLQRASLHPICPYSTGSWNIHIPVKKNFLIFLYRNRYS